MLISETTGDFELFTGVEYAAEVGDPLATRSYNSPISPRNSLNWVSTHDANASKFPSIRDFSLAMACRSRVVVPAVPSDFPPSSRRCASTARPSG